MRKRITIKKKPTMPLSNYANALIRWFIYLLLMTAGAFILLMIQTNGHLAELISRWKISYIILTTAGIVMLWLAGSSLYACFKPGGRRVYAAAWLGVFWALPISLYFTPPNDTDFPVYAEYLIHGNLLIPCIAIIPTLFLVWTEPRNGDKRTLHPLRFLLHTGMAMVMTAGIIYFFYGTASPDINEVKSAMEFKVDGVNTEKNRIHVEARIFNHSNEPLYLNNCDAIIMGHPNNGEFSRCACCSSFHLPENLCIPAGSSLPLSLVFYHANIEYGLWLEFSSIILNGVKYRYKEGLDGITIKAKLPREKS